MKVAVERLYERINGVQAYLTRSAGPSLASLFHEQTKRRPYSRYEPPAPYPPDLLADFSRSAFKEYRLAARIPLPPAEELPGSLNRLILERRTSRVFTGQALPLQAVGTLLALSYQILGADLLHARSPHIPKRPVPSGGALYPLEIYLAALEGVDFPAGRYHYHPAQHALEILDAEVAETTLRQCFPLDTFPPGARLVIGICGVMPRNRFKYGELGYRLMLLEAGHLAQNLLLVAQALGLGCMPCCGFYDDRLHDYLAIDGVDEVGLYLLPIGYPASSGHTHSPVEVDP